MANQQNPNTEAREKRGPSEKNNPSRPHENPPGQSPGRGNPSDPGEIERPFESGRTPGQQTPESPGKRGVGV